MIETFSPQNYILLLLIELSALLCNWNYPSIVCLSSIELASGGLTSPSKRLEMSKREAQINVT